MVQLLGDLFGTTLADIWRAKSWERSSELQVPILVVQLMVQIYLAISGHLPGGPSGGPNLPVIFGAIRCLSWWSNWWSKSTLSSGHHPGGPSGGPYLPTHPAVYRWSIWWSIGGTCLPKLSICIHGSLFRNCNL